MLISGRHFQQIMDRPGSVAISPGGHPVTSHPMPPPPWTATTSHLLPKAQHQHLQHRNLRALRLPCRCSQSRFGSPWFFQASYGHPMCNLNLFRFVSLSPPLPVYTVYMYVCMYVMYVCMYVCMLCMYVCMYVWS